MPCAGSSISATRSARSIRWPAKWQSWSAKSPGMGARRIARTVTGRETVVLFTGAYHGIVDEVIVRGTKKLRAVPAAPGILRNTAEHVLVLDYGTPESLEIIRERAHELAAVLIEPVQSRRPDFRPVEFLREVRAI